MSHEGGGMKLRDLARSSSNPTSFMPAFHIFWSRFGNRGTSRSSRKSYESVPRSFSTPHLLTSLQQASMDHILNFLRPPRYPGCRVTFPIRTHYGDRDICNRVCRRPAFLYFLIFEQNQNKVYHEVLIAGDLSDEDKKRATALPAEWTPFPYGGSTSDTAEFVYGNYTVYLAQPSLSQFLPGGSGVGIFDPASSILNGPPNNTLSSMGRNTPKSDTGVILRYPPSAPQRCSSSES